MERVHPQLADGDLGNGIRVPPLEPLHLKVLTINHGPELQGKFSDLVVHGASDFTIDDMVADVSRLRFEYTLLLPQINFTGRYQMKMKLLLLDMQGKGDVQGWYKNARARVRLQGVRYERADGADGMRLEKLEAKIQMEDAHFHLTNLFGDNPALTGLGNRFVNENSKLFVDEMMPALEHSLAKTFRRITNDVMAEMSLAELFPDT